VSLYETEFVCAECGDLIDRGTTCSCGIDYGHDDLCPCDRCVYDDDPNLDYGIPKPGM